jgi:ATP-binding cassette subfamily C (CFTR/MRP) protein 1
MVEF